MALIKFNDGPLDGEQREAQDTNALATEYPGYSPVKQEMDPDKGETVLAVWGGDDSMLNNYPEQQNRDSDPDRKDQASAQDQANQGQRTASQEPKSTGAEKRENKNDTAQARAEGDKGAAKSQIKQH